MIENPWGKLPPTAPFILPEDTHVISTSPDFKKLRLEVPPDPFIGNPKTARVIFLALNPGFKDPDLKQHLDSELYWQETRRNLTHQSNPPFFFFNEGLTFSGGNKWWSRILKPLMSAGITKKQLSKRIMCIQYFPYHSITYNHFRQVLPSQYYSFQLVRQAIAEGKMIVMMRSERLWTEAVQELKDTSYVKLRNPRNPTISAKNMEGYAFQAILEKLR